MTAYPHYFEYVQDTQGNSIAGASVRVELQADSSLVNLYSDTTGLVPIANPLTTDANGEASFFVAPGVYKLTVTYGAVSYVKTYVTLGGGTGDVSGPESSTLHGIPTFANTGGKLLEDSGKVISTATDLGAGSASNNNIPTQLAVKTYVDALADALNLFQYKSTIDCSSNPNYPAASAGHVYLVSVAGKIGGGSGIDVEAGDMLFCKTDSTASGTHAGVGSNWDIIQFNVVAPLKQADIGVTVQGYDANTAKLNAAQAWTRPQRSTGSALTHNTSWDGTTIQRPTVNVNGSAFTIENPTSHTADVYYAITVTYTTAHSIAWGNQYKGVSSITPTATAGAKDHFIFLSDGTNLYCTGYNLNIGA